MSDSTRNAGDPTYHNRKEIPDDQDILKKIAQLDWENKKLLTERATLDYKLDLLKRTTAGYDEQNLLLKEALIGHRGLTDVCVHFLWELANPAFPAAEGNAVLELQLIRHRATELVKQINDLKNPPKAAPSPETPAPVPPVPVKKKKSATKTIARRTKKVRPE